jgi:hypothetical protein
VIDLPINLPINFVGLYTKDGGNLMQRRKDAKTQRGVVVTNYSDSICVFFAPLRELDFPHGWRRTFRCKARPVFNGIGNADSAKGVVSSYSAASNSSAAMRKGDPI